MRSDALEADALEELERSLHRAEVRRQADLMASYLSDEFVEIGRSGRVYDKAQILEAVGAEPDGVAIEASDFVFRRIAEGVVLVTYATRSHNGSALRSSIWRKAGERWLLVFHQGTPANGTRDI